MFYFVYQGVSFLFYSYIPDVLLIFFEKLAMLFGKEYVDFCLFCIHWNTNRQDCWKCNFGCKPKRSGPATLELSCDCVHASIKMVRDLRLGAQHRRSVCVATIQELNLILSPFASRSVYMLSLPADQSIIDEYSATFTSGMNREWACLITSFAL